MTVRCTKSIPVPPVVLSSVGGYPSSLAVWVALRAMLPPGRIGEWPKENTCRAGYQDIAVISGLRIGAVRSGAARLVKGGLLKKPDKPKRGSKIVWTLPDPAAVLCTAPDEGDAADSGGAADSNIKNAAESNHDAPTNSENAVASTPPPDKDGETFRKGETDRDGRSSSSPPLDGSGSCSPSGAWLDRLSDGDLSGMEHPDAAFVSTWKQMNADDRRAYLTDVEAPANWTIKVREVRATWTSDGSVKAGRYPSLPEQVWKVALERAGGHAGRDDLLVALDEVAGEVEVLHPDRHCLMVAGWVAAGERPRGARAKNSNSSSKVRAQYDALERQRNRESGRRAL